MFMDVLILQYIQGYETTVRAFTGDIGQSSSSVSPFKAIFYLYIKAIFMCT